MGLVLFASDRWSHGASGPVLSPDVRALVASMKIYYIIKAALQDSASVLMAEAAAIALAAAITAQLGLHDTNFLLFIMETKVPASSFLWEEDSDQLLQTHTK